MAGHTSYVHDWNMSIEVACSDVRTLVMNKAESQRQ